MSGTLRVYRSARSTYIVFGTMWFPLFALMMAAIVKNPKEPSAWQFLAILLGVGILIYLWIRAYRLKLDQTTIAYRSLFGGHHQVSLADIAAAGSPSGPKRFSEPLLPPDRIEITMKHGTRPTHLIINAKVFSLQAIADLKQVLAPVWRN